MLSAGSNLQPHNIILNISLEMKYDSVHINYTLQGRRIHFAVKVYRVT